jgi:hypothetical protein
MSQQKPSPAETPVPAAETPAPKAPAKPYEKGGPPGLEPTRYGDWVIGGKCVDF